MPSPITGVSVTTAPATTQCSITYLNGGQRSAWGMTGIERARQPQHGLILAFSPPSGEKVPERRMRDETNRFKIERPLVVLMADQEHRAVDQLPRPGVEHLDR